ncbi:MAG: NusG domain II-containing protein [Candidatus Aminicenantes bacterium]
MNRRHFIQTLVTVPLLSKFILGSKNTANSTELHLISDHPHQILPRILEELKNHSINDGNKFCLLNSAPFEKQIIQELKKKGWAFSPSQDKADLSLSFRVLQHKIQPSFTLTKNGNIWDIRSKRLFSLWKTINKKNNLSSSLTIASFRGSAHRFMGKSISVFSQGKKIDSFPLNKNSCKSYKAKQGRIMVSVNNGKVWVTESSCRHKICCLTPPISFAGERIICAPNRFLVEIDRTSLIDTSIG